VAATTKRWLTGRHTKAGHEWRDMPAQRQRKRQRKRDRHRQKRHWQRQTVVRPSNEAWPGHVGSDNAQLKLYRFSYASLGGKERYSNVQLQLRLSGFIDGLFPLTFIVFTCFFNDPSTFLLALASSPLARQISNAWLIFMTRSVTERYNKVAGEQIHTHICTCHNDPTFV